MHYEEDMASEIMTSIWKSLRDPSMTWVTKDEMWHAIHRLVFERCINRANYNTRKKRLNVLEIPVLFDEIADRWQVTVRTVQRKMGAVRQLFEGHVMIRIGS